MRQLGQSLLSEAFTAISMSQGSPFIEMDALIKAGANHYVPVKVTKMTYSMDFQKNYSDLIYLYCLMPKGDVTKHLVPFQDDLSIELTSRMADATVRHPRPSDDPLAVEEEDEEDITIPIIRKFKAYLDDHVDYAIQSTISNQKMENLTDLEVVIFRIEDRLVEQLRYYQINVPVNRLTTPFMCATSILNSFAKGILLEEGEEYIGICADDTYNKAMSWSITIPSGTDLLDVPDIMQNEKKGIYKDALGFYILNGIISLWGLYDMDREEQKAFTGLRINLAPDTASTIIERTWRVPKDSPKWIEIWASKIVAVEDDSLTEKLNTGVGSRAVNNDAIVEGYVSVKDNKIRTSQAGNNTRFTKGATVTGTQKMLKSKGSDSLYIQSSKLAKGMGMKVSILWNHSYTNKILPGMYVEMIYDYQGEIRIVKGALLGIQTLIAEEGKGIVKSRMKSTSVITIFIDRELPEFKEWVEEGAIGASTQPEKEV